MQVIEASNLHYRGIKPAIQSIFATEGIAGFYRGMLPGMLAASGSWGGYFYLYEFSKDQRRKSRNGQMQDPSQFPLGVRDHVCVQIRIIICSCEIVMDEQLFVVCGPVAMRSAGRMCNGLCF